MSPRELPDILPYDLEDDLWQATAADGRGRMRVFSLPRPVVILGRGSRPEVELDLGACRADRVPMLRRRGGGCAVVLDPGNVIVAASFPVQGIGDNPKHFDRLCRWLIAGLERAGGSGVYRDGISDLALGDRKVGGSCIYRGRGVLLFSCSLLVSPEVELIERYLTRDTMPNRWLASSTTGTASRS